jgi:hypothetical protein
MGETLMLTVLGGGIFTHPHAHTHTYSIALLLVFVVVVKVDWFAELGLFGSECMWCEPGLWL